VVLATRSFAYNEFWNAQAQAVIDLAGLTIPAQVDEDSLPEPSISLVYPVGSTLESSEASKSTIDTLYQWALSAHEEGTKKLLCVDVGSVVQSRQIPQITSTGTTCGEIADLCSDQASFGVRGLCPITCECSSSRLGRSGFYQASEWGCPSSCSVLLAIEMSAANCSDVLPEADVWSPYVYGLWQYMTEFLQEKTYIHTTLQENYALFGIQESDVETVYSYFTGSGFWDGLAGFTYLFAEGIPHPRNLTGCSFMASVELKLLLGVDLCAADTHASLLGTCPLSCGCLIDSTGCPAACNSK